MKTVLEFDCTDVQEERHAQLALGSKSIALSIYEFKLELIKCMNDGFWMHREATGAERDFAEEVLKYLNECLDETGCRNAIDEC
jgi:hypothetical protein